MKNKITIEWDSETREALVQINDLKTKRWKESDFSLMKDFDETTGEVVLWRLMLNGVIEQQ